MVGSIPDKDWKILWSKSLSCCSFPECKKKLITTKTSNDSEANIGENAHIKGEKPCSARYDNAMTDKERNSEKNLILLCVEHHKIIDSQPHEYTSEKLLKFKSDHERWAENILRSVTPDVTFAELKVVTDYLVNSTECSDESLVLIPPKEKIDKNRLSAQVERLIKIGNMQVKQVSDYIKSCKDVKFENRLIIGFRDEYDKLKEDGLDGDGLFNSLSLFASKGSNDPKLVSAGLTVLSYLFERCEVFEK